MRPEVVKAIAEVRLRVSEGRHSRKVIGFVPTMGALHAGHAALMERARTDSDFLVVSIFVNPIQFDRKEDYERYARTLPEDVALCAERGVDLIFAPEPDEMYPTPLLTTVDVDDLSAGLCGEFRPGHFRGVATVVAKLFQIVQPDRAYFGEKDAQQLAVIRRMVSDLNMPVEIVPVPTVREADGLALSSRNQRLNAEERRAASVLYRALVAASRLVEQGCKDPAKIRQVAFKILSEEAAVRLEYFEIVDPDRMSAVQRISGPVRIAIAAWLGSTRLIDNMLCD